jgi:hypothetical protein
MTDSSVAALLQFVEARLDEDFWWARNAGGRYDHTPPATGEHWQWVETRGDEPVKPDPTAGEYLDYPEGGPSRGLALRSVEQYPSGSVGDLPSFIISTAEEVNTVAAGHIVRHDPAHVLRAVEAGRKLLDVYREAQGFYTNTNAPAGEMTGLWTALRLLASHWADHKDYDPDWAV